MLVENRQFARKR